MLSIVIHGSWHLWHLVWSGNAPVMLGGNLSRVFCLLQQSAERAKRAEPYLQLSPLQPRIRRSCILYIALQPVLRSMMAAVCLFGAASELAAPRGVFFTAVVHIHRTYHACYGSRKRCILVAVSYLKYLSGLLDILLQFGARHVCSCALSHGPLGTRPMSASVAKRWGSKQEGPYPATLSRYIYIYR